MSLKLDPNSPSVAWKIATKTKPIKAKPLVCLLVDRSMTSKFLVDTLEGKEPLGDGVMICLGQSLDVWQQSPRKLLQKYNVTSVDKDGWMDCEPRPDNAVECFEVTEELINAVCMPQGGWFGEFYIIGLWGETVGTEKNVQRGTKGDYICRNPTDVTDIWIVRKKIFENTYSVKG